jgi:hypothetical protein
MRLETEFLLLGWGFVGAILANALFSERKRPEGKEPVGFWRAMEVLGLWAAVLVGLSAIYFSTRDSGEQVGTMREQLRAMRDQLRTMSGQLDEMQIDARPWLRIRVVGVDNFVVTENRIQFGLVVQVC